MESNPDWFNSLNDAMDKDGNKLFSEDEIQKLTDAGVHTRCYGNETSAGVMGVMEAYTELLARTGVEVDPVDPLVFTKEPPIYRIAEERIADAFPDLPQYLDGFNRQSRIGAPLAQKPTVPNPTVSSSDLSSMRPKDTDIQRS